MKSGSIITEELLQEYTTGQWRQIVIQDSGKMDYIEGLDRSSIEQLNSCKIGLITRSKSSSVVMNCHPAL